MSPLPTQETGEVFLEQDLIVKVEMAPFPAVTADHRMNLNTQASLNWIRRLMEQVIGPVRLSGFSITADGINVTVNPGELMTKFYYINKIAGTNFTQVASDRIVFLTLTTKRITFEDDPALGISVAGRGTLAGPSIYQGTLTFSYVAGPLPGPIAGTGADGTFTRTAGTFVVDAEIGKEVEFFDVDGRLIGPFVVSDNDATILIFKGDATGATQVLTDHFVKLADVDSAGVVTQALPLIPTGGGGGGAELWHEQNTDTHTTQPQFFVNAPTGPTDPGAKRVLTIDDLVTPAAQIGRHPGSILTNGGFELGFDGWIRGTPTDGAIETDVGGGFVRTGLQSLRFDVKAAAQFVDTEVTYETHELLDTTPLHTDSRNIRIFGSMFFRQSVADPNVDLKLLIRWLDKDQVLLLEEVIASKSPTGPTTFAELRTDKTGGAQPEERKVPVGAQFFKIRILVDGDPSPTGSWFVDDVLIAVVPSISNLFDTLISGSLAKNHALVYDAADDRWINRLLAGNDLTPNVQVSQLSQSIPDAATTVVLYDTESYDSDAMHSTVSNTDRLTVPTGKGGLYIVNSANLWDGAIGGDRRRSQITRNGLGLAQSLDARDPLGVVSVTETTHSHAWLFISPGDILRTEVFQNSGGALDVFSIFSAIRLFALEDSVLIP